MSDNKNQDEQPVLRKIHFDMPPIGFNDKSFRRKVWKTRWRMFLNTLGAALLLFMVYAIYISAIHIYFNQSEAHNKFLHSIMTVVEIHGDAIRVDKSYHGAFEVTPYLSQKATLKTYQYVGGWEVITGEVQAEMSITGRFTYSIIKSGPYMNENNSGPFYLEPSMINGNRVGSSSPSSDIANPLSKIDDGHVAEISVSTTQLMTPDELMNILTKYDVIVTSMPVFAGELTEFQPHAISSGGSGYNVSHLSLRPTTNFIEDGASWQLYFSRLDAGQMEQHTRAMLADLEWITTHLKYYGSEHDQKRLEYLQRNGVHVYGAVITGPVRELEKIAKLPEFSDLNLGHIEIWKWDETLNAAP